tara:strand:+ start:63 stop:236 length:174 start_codon:yes stop_codon:yes gene_type:complete
MTMDEFLMMLVGFGAGILIGMMIIIVGSENHKTIIQNGYGLYCPNTGDFAFIGECEQ